MRDGKNGYSPTPVFDFTALGRKIKQEREAHGITREQLAEMLDYAPRHIQAIENEGQHPSFQLLAQLVTMFDVSVDAYLFPAKQGEKSALRRKIDRGLDGLSQRELTVVEALLKGLYQSRNCGETQEGCEEYKE